VWWHSFWPDGGFLTYEYTVLESLYFLMQYKFGSAARRGRAFMDLNGPWLIDGAKQEPVDCLPSEEVVLFYSEMASRVVCLVLRINRTHSIALILPQTHPPSQAPMPQAGTGTKNTEERPHTPTR
jgi:hypothetical protein